MQTRPALGPKVGLVSLDMGSPCTVLYRSVCLTTALGPRRLCVCSFPYTTANRGFRGLPLSVMVSSIGVRTSLVQLTENSKVYFLYAIPNPHPPHLSEYRKLIFSVDVFSRVWRLHCRLVLTLTFGEYIGDHTGVTLARRLTLLLLLAVTLASAFAQTGVVAQRIRRRICDQYLFTYLLNATL